MVPVLRNMYQLQNRIHMGILDMSEYEENEEVAVVTADETIQEITINNAKVRVGTVKVSDGKSLPMAVRLYLTINNLRLQREELVYEDLSEGENKDRDYPNETEIRIVKLQRGESGGLGFKIKGGTDYDLPILISLIEKGQAADKAGNLFVGDGIIKVNGEMILQCTHDEGVKVLKYAGDIVILTVKHFKHASYYLLKIIEEKKNEMKETLEEKVEIEKPENLTLTKKWVDLEEIPLGMAFLTRYHQGTDKLIPLGFEVFAMDLKKRSGLIYCQSAATLSQWIKFISVNITALTQLEIRMYNRYCGIEDKIEYMGWVSEGIPIGLAPNKVNWNAYETKFFAIKGEKAFILEKPPIKKEDWEACDQTSYKLYECQLKVVKESDILDEKSHCLLFCSIGKTTRYIAVETMQELIKIETAWNTTVFNTVKRIGLLKFAVTVGHPRVPAEFRIDWKYGFGLYDVSDDSCVWKYKYSQLKGSTDDGKTKLKLHFRDRKTNGIETREFECYDLESLLFGMVAYAGSKINALEKCG